MRLSVVLSAFVFSLCLFGSSHASTVVLNDTFDSPSYSVFSLNEADTTNNPDDISFASFGGTNNSGGNPDAYGLLFHTHDVNRDSLGEPIGGNGFTFVQSFLGDQTASYTPSLEGAIQFISFSLDVRTGSPIDSLFFDISDSNGGSVANGSGGFLSLVNDGEWNTYTLVGVAQSGASGRDFAGSNPLRFGFGFTSSADVFGGSSDFSIDVDNFIVTVTQVPEPAAFVLMLLGVAVSLRRLK